MPADFFRPSYPCLSSSTIQFDYVVISAASSQLLSHSLGIPSRDIQRYVKDHSLFVVAVVKGQFQWMSRVDIVPNPHRPRLSPSPCSSNDLISLWHGPWRVPRHDVCDRLDIVPLAHVPDIGEHYGCFGFGGGVICIAFYFSVESSD